MTEEQTDARDDFRKHLVATGLPAEDASTYAEAVNLGAFQSADGQVDTARLHGFADRYFYRDHPKRTSRRDFGAGNRAGGGATRRGDGVSVGDAGADEADKRFGSTGQGPGSGGGGASEADRRFKAKA